MGWFEEQIHQRIQNDNDAFSNAFFQLAHAAMGEKLARRFRDNRTHGKTAIDQILKYYHIKGRAIPDNLHSLDDQLEYLMRPHGVMRRRVDLKGHWYRNASGAMLGAKKDGTPVALLPRKLWGYQFFDPEAGRYIPVNRKTAKQIDSEAICFYEPLPMQEVKPGNLWKYALRLLSPYEIAAVLLAAGAAALIGLLIPKINEIIYSQVVASHSLQLLAAIFTLYLCVWISRTLLLAVGDLSTERIGNKVSNFIQTSVMMRLLSLPASFFRKHSVGELSNDMICIGQSAKLLVKISVTIILSFLSSAVYLLQMAAYSAPLARAAILVLATALGLCIWGILAERKTIQKVVEKEGEEQGTIFSLIEGIQKIKLAGAEKRAFSYWAKAYEEVLREKYTPPFLVKVSRILPSCIALVGMTVLSYTAVKIKISVADYFAFYAAYGMVLGALTAFMEVSHLLAQVGPILHTARPILEEPPEIAENRGVISRISGGVELNNISFRYSENMPPVLDGLSLKIRPGQYVAIVGASGCGKSTLMRIMLGFEKPQKGAVYYDGRDLSTLDVKSLRRHMGVVTQNEKLFPGDIFSNIAISAPHLTMEEAWKAAELAGAAEDIRSMPMGMYTLISENNGGISGGQRQRIIIARAIASKPKILLFDEATSALDNITQKTVSDSLAKLKCTRIVIAHRLSTIRQCDRILVLQEGKIQEEGSYEELMQKRGFFAQLVNRQKLD